MASGGPPFYGRWPVSAVYEARLDGNWENVTVASWSPEPAGTFFTTGSYAGIDFTSSATVSFHASRDIEYLVVAGGGATEQPTNEYYQPGAGGAGGLRTNVPGNSSGGNSPLEPTFPVTPGNYTVTVGAGGAGSFVPTPYPNAIQGSNSTFGPIVSIGGGGGRRINVGFGQPGGSGGTGVSTAGSGTPGQGFPGAPNGGGGGGAGGAGSPRVGSGGGDGGVGLSNNIKGSPITLAGGGGAGSTPYYPGPDIGGIGGAGGGGDGGSYNAFATNGTANLGGGGGGSATTWSSTANATNGGSGRVIIRWLV